MTADAPVLPFTVALASQVFDAAAAAADSASRRIEAELGELLRDLGLPARPTVQLEVSRHDAANHLVRLTVDGRPCRFPPTTVAEALAYVDGTPQIPVDGDAVVGRLQAPGNAEPERLAEVLAWVCRAACSAQPGILLATTEDPAPRAALDLGMSIADGGARTGGPVSDGGDPVEQLIAALAARTIDVHIDAAYMRRLTSEDGAGERFPFLRDGLFVELGLPLPPFHFRPDRSLRPGSFAFRINALRTLPRPGLSPGTILVNDTPERLATEHGVDGEATLNPATYQPGAIVAGEHKQALEEKGLTTWGPLDFLVLSFAEAVRRNAHALMTRDVAAKLVETLGYAFPALGDAARAHAPPDALAPVLRELLLDGVPIRNLRRIVELMLRYDTTGAAEPRLDRVAFIRSGLTDVITSNAARGTGTVVVYLLDPEIEDAVAAHPDETLPDRLSAAVRHELSYLPPTVRSPALLTQDDVRRPLRDLLRHEYPRMTILSYADLPPDYNVQPVARITWA